ncbi:hypothetical protein SASPL_131159 [Salvia splendens]|uniref:Brassinosteroid-6-oxidase 1 n=1 Tax=Salvia splendens TaxID=180675 RepID=A0A8X8X6Z4_SALSN|nr:hypothetical protein SASPL_131159 [Salvia splendens]
MASFVVILGVFWGLCILSVALLKWNEVRYRKKGLPPGTMGWPLFGETTEFLKQGPAFMKNQRSRFGSFFKSHILGCPTIVSMDTELNKYILVNEAKGLVPGYPQSMLDILGKCNIAAVHGSAYKYMRGAILALINPTMIKDQLLPKIDDFMRSHLSDWDNKIMAFLSSFRQIASTEASSISETFMHEFIKLVLGTLSLPINLPNTDYHRGFQARQNITCWLRKLVEERKASGEKQGDMLGHLVGEENKYKLSDEEMIDLIITILYSGYETVSTTSMMAVNYLHDHPKVLEELRKEHMAIRERKNAEDPIDYKDYRSMCFTRAVSVANFQLKIVTLVKLGKILS